MFVIQSVVVAGIPPGVLAIVLGVIVMVVAIVIGLPLVRLVGKRLERGKPVAQPALRDAEIEALRHSVERLSIEVERVSEGQRWMLREAGAGSRSREQPDAG